MTATGSVDDAGRNVGKAANAPLLVLVLPETAATGSTDGARAAGADFCAPDVCAEDVCAEDTFAPDICAEDVCAEAGGGAVAADARAEMPGLGVGRAAGVFDVVVVDGVVAAARLVAVFDG